VAGEGGGKGAPPPTPIVGPPTPLSNMMVDVQRLQARMAQGDKDAYTEQRAKLKTVGAAISETGAEAFKTRIERDAVIVYLLSGGQPRDVAKIAERGDFPGDESELLRGAVGYALGRQSEAEKLIPFDANAQSLRLGSQLAYAQSVLLTPKDAKKSLELLDLARLLAPGSLTEEAALRREILLVGDLRDPDRVAFLARQYVERYGKSIYAGNFVEGLSQTAIKYDLCSNLASLDKFSALLELLTAEQRRAFLLAIAHASVVLGRFGVASQAARRSLTSAAPGSADEARARLYDIVSRFPYIEEEEQKTAFADVDQTKLSAADRDLLAAGAALHERMYEPPPLAAFEDVWREASVAAARSPDLSETTPDPAAATIRRAVAAVTAAEALGGKENPP
jgi:chemotaxis protein MotC